MIDDKCLKCGSENVWSTLRFAPSEGYGRLRTVKCQDCGHTRTYPDKESPDEKSSGKADGLMHELKFEIDESDKIPALTNPQTDQLSQIYTNGPIWAGDLMSKSATMELHKMGLVSYNWAWAVVTREGLRVMEVLITKIGYRIRMMSCPHWRIHHEHMTRISRCILEERGWLRNARKKAEAVQT